MKNKILCVIISIMILLAIVFGIFYKKTNDLKKQVELQIESMQASYSDRIYSVADIINLIDSKMGESDILDKVASSRDSLNKAITDDNIKLMYKRNIKLTDNLEELYKYVESLDFKDDDNYNNLKDEIKKKTSIIKKEEKKYNKEAKKYNKKLNEFPTSIFKLTKFKTI